MWRTVYKLARFPPLHLPPWIHTPKRWPALQGSVGSCIFINNTSDTSVSVWLVWSHQPFAEVTFFIFVSNVDYFIQSTSKAVKLESSLKDLNYVLTNSSSCILLQTLMSAVGRTEGAPTCVWTEEEGINAPVQLPIACPRTAGRCACRGQQHTLLAELKAPLSGLRLTSLYNLQSVFANWHTPSHVSRYYFNSLCSLLILLLVSS